MIIKGIITILFTFFLIKGVSQNYACDTLFLKTIVQTLASDSMEGRRAGTQGIKIAKIFLLNYFQKNTTTIDTFSYFLDSSKIICENIIGTIDNKADSFIIIMAHYDHIGFGGPKSRSLKDNRVHSGADDNASGISAMLQLMKFYSKKSTKKKYYKKVNFLFVALSGHEDGLFGSKHFVTRHENIIKRTKLVINFDMVGRLNKYSPTLKIVSNNIEYFKKYINSKDSLFCKFNYSNICLNNDIEAFVLQNVKCLSITTGIHDDYHKITDTADKINYEGICKLAEFIAKFIYKAF